MFRCDMRSMVGSGISLIRSLLLRAMMRGAPRTTSHGLEIVDLLADGRTDALFERARSALELIARSDPHRIARVRRDLKRIVFLESGPEYWPFVDACVLHDIRALSVGRVALLIVHEAAHARLWNAGIRYSTAERARVEHACVSAEMAFLAHVPESDELQRRTREKINETWWDTDRQFKRHQEELVAVGAPVWLQRLHERLRRPRPENSTHGKDGSP